MIYYANPSTEAIRDLMSARHLGCITTPYQGNRTFSTDGWDVIADNGCFSQRWRAGPWFTWLLNQPRNLRFAVCPDVFDPSGGPCHEATLARWYQFGPMMQRHGFTAAFVCQVGATYDTCPPDVPLFLGGTTEWKLGTEAWDIVGEAKRAGRWVHMGRVNSRRRFRTARMMGCHSVDGTFLTRGPDKNLPRLLRWLEDAETQPILWDAR